MWLNPDYPTMSLHPHVRPALFQLEVVKQSLDLFFLWPGGDRQREEACVSLPQHVAQMEMSSWGVMAMVPSLLGPTTVEK